MANDKEDVKTSEKKSYVIAKTRNIGSNKKGEARKKLTKGDKVSLTAQEAAVYKSQKLI